MEGKKKTTYAFGVLPLQLHAQCSKQDVIERTWRGVRLVDGQPCFAAVGDVAFRFGDDGKFAGASTMFTQGGGAPDADLLVVGDLGRAVDLASVLGDDSTIGIVALSSQTISVRLRRVQWAHHQILPIKRPAVSVLEPPTALPNRSDYLRISLLQQIFTFFSINLHFLLLQKTPRLNLPDELTVPPRHDGWFSP